MMADCSADRGIIICDSGWSIAAGRRAEKCINLKIIPSSSVGDFNEYAISDECGCGNGIAFYDNKSITLISGTYLITFIGKCDKCHSFNIWCQGCGDHFWIRDDEDYRCNCDFLWCVATSEGEDDAYPEGLTAHLFLIDENNEAESVVGRVHWMDRRRDF